MNFKRIQMSEFQPECLDEGRRKLVSKNDMHQRQLTDTLCTINKQRSQQLQRHQTEQRRVTQRYQHIATNRSYTGSTGEQKDETGSHPRPILKWQDKTRTILAEREKDPYFIDQKALNNLLLGRLVDVVDDKLKENKRLSDRRNGVQFASSPLRRLGNITDEEKCLTGHERTKTTDITLHGSQRMNMNQFSLSAPDRLSGEHFFNRQHQPSDHHLPGRLRSSGYIHQHESHISMNPKRTAKSLDIDAHYGTPTKPIFKHRHSEPPRTDNMPFNACGAIPQDPLYPYHYLPGRYTMNSAVEDKPTRAWIRVANAWRFISSNIDK